MVVLVAPLFEEWLFRGVVYRNLRRSQGIIVSVALSSVLFMVIHPLESSLPVLVLAIVTALVFERTRRVYPGILIHMGYNAIVVAAWSLISV
jgi:ABC-2 type transport system permease protein